MLDSKKIIIVYKRLVICKMGLINWLLYTGLWTEPFVLYGLCKFTKFNISNWNNELSTLFTYVVLSFLPALYICNQNSIAKRNGKSQFGLLDAGTYTHDPAYQSSYGDRAKYPIIHPSLQSNKCEGIVFGKFKGKYVRKQLKEDGHILVIGGSGSGKSSCLVIPTLLNNPDTSVFAIDIKGELSFKSVSLTDPSTVIFNPNDRTTYGYDPFYRLHDNVNDQEIMECMQLTAQSLIPMSADIPDPFWKQSARTLLTGILIYFYKRGYTNLPDICHEILKQPMRELLNETISNDIDSGVVEEYFIKSYIGMADETLSGIASEISLHITLFAADQNIKYAFKENPIKMSPKMLTDKKKIFLSIREEKLTSYYDVMQLIINQTLAELELRSEDAEPVLIIIDELPRILSQGRIEKLLDSARTLRSRKVTLFLVTQSIDALLSAYKEAEVDDLISNCPYIIVLSASSDKTQRKVIAWSGKYKDKKVSYTGTGKDRRTSISFEDKDIVEPQELITLCDKGEAILITSHGYYRVKKAPYYKEKKYGEKSKENLNKSILELELQKDALSYSNILTKDEPK